MAVEKIGISFAKPESAPAADETIKVKGVATDTKISVSREETPTPAADEADKMSEADLRKSYKELRAKMSAGVKPEAKPEEKAPEPTPEEKAASEAEVKTAAAEKVIQSNLVAAFGSAEKVSEAMEWANSALDADSVAAYNAAMDSGNPAIVKYAISVLAAEHAKHNGKEPTLVRGEPVAAAGAQGFSDSAEMVAAMRDPRYETSPAYRKSVADRIARSKSL